METAGIFSFKRFLEKGIAFLFLYIIILAFLCKDKIDRKTIDVHEKCIETDKIFVVEENAAYTRHTCNGINMQQNDKPFCDAVHFRCNALKLWMRECFMKA